MTTDLVDKIMAYEQGEMAQVVSRTGKDQRRR